MIQRSSWRTHLQTSFWGAVVGVVVGTLLRTTLLVDGLVVGWTFATRFVWLLLPLTGWLTGMAVDRWFGGCGGGLGRIIQSIDGRAVPMPLRQTVLGWLGGPWARLVGGTAGMIVPLGVGWSEWLASRRWPGIPRREVLVAAALATGFASLFGVKLAGIVWAFELLPRRVFRGTDVLPVGIAATVGGILPRWGAQVPAPPGVGHWDGRDLVVAALVAGLAGGVAARLYCWGFVGVGRALTRLTPRRPLQLALGGLLILLVRVMFQGEGPVDPRSSLDRSCAGAGSLVDGGMLLLRTVLTLGSGFAGGDVGPLWQAGALLGGGTAAGGSALGGLDPVLLAGLGAAAVYGTAVRAPLTMAVLHVELWGWEVLAPTLLALMVARALSPGGGLYDASGWNVFGWMDRTRPSMSGGNAPD